MKLEKLFLIAGIIFIVMTLVNQNKETPTPVVTPVTTGGNTIDLCKLVDGQASFTGQRQFVAGTAIPTEFVRVISRNGENKDLGQISLNGGVLATKPGLKYSLYFGENQTTYYTNKEDYTGPCDSATDPKMGILCAVGTPTISVLDEFGAVQTSLLNGQAMTNNDVKDITVRVKVPTQQCFGNPEATIKNAICFDYNTTAFKSVKANTASRAVPYSVGAAKGAALGENCYELNLLKDGEKQDVVVTLSAQNVDPGSTTSHNITVRVKDVDMDLNQDTLEEIWGTEDESNNVVGSAATSGTIYII